MRILLVFSALVLWAGQVQAAVFFEDGFEYASQGAFEAVWATSCPGSASLMGPSSAFAEHGARSLRSIQNGGVNSCYVDRPYPQTPQVFYRWNLRLAPGYDTVTVCRPGSSCDGGNGSKQMYAKALGTGYGVFWHLESNRTIRTSVMHGGYATLCPNGRQDEECFHPPNVGAPVVITPGTTACIETELVRGSPGRADGVVRVWINGVLTTQYTNVSFARSGEGGGFNTVTHYSQAGYGTRYIDDLAVGNTRIGCGGTGPSPVDPPIPPIPPVVTQPAAPVLTAVVSPPTSITVTWPVLAGATIDLRWAVKGTGWGASTSASCSTSPCTIPGLTPGTTYELQAVHYKGTPNVDAVFSPLSAVAEVTMPKPSVDPPSATPCLSIIMNTAKEVRIQAKPCDP